MLDYTSVRILIVEDEFASQQALQNLLTAHGFDTDAVGTADQAACALARREGFDVILLDVDLPDGDGLQILENILGSHPRTRPVLVTGADHQRVVSATERGVPYLPKPLDFDRLLDLLRQWPRAD